MKVTKFKSMKIGRSNTPFPEFTESQYDEDEKFIFTKTLEYLKSHFSRYFTFNDDAMELLCWVFGHDSVLIGDFFIENHKQKHVLALLKDKP